MVVTLDGPRPIAPIHRFGLPRTGFERIGSDLWGGRNGQRHMRHAPTAGEEGSMAGEEGLNPSPLTCSS